MDEERAKLFHLGVRLVWPEIWADAIETQWGRVVEAREALRRLPPFGADTPEMDDLEGRLTWEVHFLVVAIRQLLLTQEAYLKETDDDRLAKARPNFDAAVAHAVEFRIFLEHLTSTCETRGDCRRRVPSLLALSSWSIGGASPGA